MDRFDELQIFVAILDAGSLSGAARRLRRSAPAVTRALAALEERVGARLVERTTRRLAATEAGLRLAEMARRVLADYDDAVREDDNGPLRGRLRITVPAVFGRRHVAPAMIDFLDLHPALQVELVFNDRNLDMIEHGLDLAVRIGPLPDTGMMARQVGQVRRMLVASPAYLARRGTPSSPRELDAHDIIFSEQRTATEWRFLEAGRADGREFAVRLAPRLIVNEIDTMLLAVQAGRGIGRPLSYQVTEQLAAGTLVRLLPDSEPAPLPVQLLVPSARHMAPRLRACIDFLAPHLAALPVLQPVAPAKNA
ncbi:LysR family transcriptional regulator [Massilia pseudoviolaceinigra]|uniref:LysR family transcriptional regulator n=1 Tax=Massilia pseudoviolaceinigra TaxID=3057165 RepID=UPI0027967CFD|nr:LysR family transcriptional regulator [Massilia sp. CCM 9206]MDQ1924856.1 LysR family transcriptional regulator [Massilia sp. CCM 9206]